MQNRGAVQKSVTESDLYNFRIPLLNHKQHVNFRNKINSNQNKLTNENEHLQNNYSSARELSDSALNSSKKILIKYLESNKKLAIIHGVPINKKYRYAPDFVETNHYYPFIHDIKNYSINLATSKRITNNVYKNTSNRDITHNDVFISLMELLVS